MSEITVQEIIHLLPTVDADWHERAVAFLADLGKDNCSTANVCVQMMEEHTELRRQLAEAEGVIQHYQMESHSAAMNHWRERATAAEAKLALAEQNDRRYRWLRGEGFERPATMWVTNFITKLPVVHTDLDKAIDAAIDAGEGK